MKLAKETVLTLMQYVDGELAGDDKERAAKLVKEDPEAARFVAELEALSKQVESIVLARGAEVAPDFDVADDVMAAIERDAQEAETKPERVRLVAIAGGAKKTEEAKPAAKPAEPAGRTTEESRFRRIGIVAVATLALAAGVAFMMKQQGPADGKSGPQATKTAAPRGPVTGEVSVEGPKTPETVAKAEPSGAVHVDQVQAPSHGVSVFELPETTAASSSVVVWIDESVGGQQ